MADCRDLRPVGVNNAYIGQWLRTMGGKNIVSKGAVGPPQGQDPHFSQIYFAVSHHQKHSRALSMRGLWV